MRRAFWLGLVLAAVVSWSGRAQDLSAGRVWGLGVQLIPATSFRAGDFSFPTLTVSLRAWRQDRWGAELAFTFGLFRPETQTGSFRFRATAQVRSLFKFVNTAETDFYLGLGVVARVREGELSLPAARFDLGAEFNPEPHRAWSAELGYGLRLLGSGEFLDRLTTGLGLGMHAYPARRGGGT